ncbi:PLC-like phosphodiesterase [Lophiostoma macrostomum CBS 122681]|uniref:PLC-like phosphodiesterase n=1 Tax=Lophiostoma macrostomum CBS 122681 TaxID=1314788 RepID=A0A6A6TE27_9PLEO|nr:PLC-like phosphodiesterase [Lophiostoma macrostomum CBS 122681]
MASSLAIRNLTATPLAIKSIERFADPDTQQSKKSAFFFASKTTTTLAPSAPELGERAQTFQHQHIDVILLPYDSYTCNSPDTSDDQPTATQLTSSTLRITVEIHGGECYRIDINPTYTQKHSRTLTPLTPSPSAIYTALFHPTRPVPHLTLHANQAHDLSNWMSRLPSELPLSALSIPGTHNSHTCYPALPSVRCQLASVQTQLENGIRFLDIRVQPTYATDPSKKDLQLVHGAFPISLMGKKYLEPVLKICYRFLDNHPSETILISLKREGTGNSTDEHLSQVLQRHYIEPNSDKWHVDSELPYLRDIRGKLVLVRRYLIHQSLKVFSGDEEKGYGLDATEWPDNSKHAIHGPFCVQDFYGVMEPSMIHEKLQHSNDHLVKAAECVSPVPGINTDRSNPVPPGPLYLNYLSASNFWRSGCWPDKIAKVVNRGIEECASLARCYPI